MSKSYSNCQQGVSRKSSLFHLSKINLIVDKEFQRNLQSRLVALFCTFYRHIYEWVQFIAARFSKGFLSVCLSSLHIYINLCRPRRPWHVCGGSLRDWTWPSPRTRRHRPHRARHEVRGKHLKCATCPKCGWLVGWLVGGCLFSWSIGRSVGRMVRWIVGRSVIISWNTVGREVTLPLH